METIKEVVSWIATHWEEMVTAFLSVVGALEVIAKWTETDKDDKVASLLKEWTSKVNKAVIKIIGYLTLKGTK